ncbi:response regulator transcription factor [Elioraea thermophila]|uniref:response regulator transcription factor n=1 Tax=Elioraea thermophila TaxID=2185104 RepID=UPI000DF18483|nr:response regulator transcription factor [Elioraea thermophila]
MRALVVEDDPTIAQGVARALVEAGFVVDRTGDGEEAEHLGSTEPYDVAVLDLGLPARDGLAVLESWRKARATFPVLILTARDRWADKLAGFRAGADDYVIKPFRLEEVVLRVQALVRRAAGHAQAVIAAGALAYDTQLGTFTLEGMPLKLTAMEHRVLAYLIHRAGRVVSRSELAEHVYDGDADRDFNALEVIIGRLRRKIGADAIETERGRGYRLRR